MGEEEKSEEETIGRVRKKGSMVLWKDAEPVSEPLSPGSGVSPSAILTKSLNFLGLQSK